MLSGLYVARLSALALDGVPGLLGTGEDGAKLSSWDAAEGGVAVLMEGRGLLGGVCRSVCDLDSLVGEFGPGSEPAEDQAVMKLRTARKKEGSGRGLEGQGGSARRCTSGPRHVGGNSRVSHRSVPVRLARAVVSWAARRVAWRLAVFGLGKSEWQCWRGGIEKSDLRQQGVAKTIVVEAQRPDDANN